MNELLGRDARVLWSFWLACALAMTGGSAPWLLAFGGPNRLAAAIIPYGVAAGAMAANALMYRRGRSLATALYFLAGVAIVYGMLLMFSVPLRLAVTGTCPDPPAVCPAGLERSLTSGEAAGFPLAIITGVLSILSGFFGLVMLYRSRPKPHVPVPMARVIPPVDEKMHASPEAATDVVAKAEPETGAAPDSPAAEKSTAPPTAS